MPCCMSAPNAAVVTSNEEGVCMGLWSVSIAVLALSILINIYVLIATNRQRRQYLQMTEEYRLAYEHLMEDVKAYLCDEFGIIWDVKGGDNARD